MPQQQLPPQLVLPAATDSSDGPKLSDSKRGRVARSTTIDTNLLIVNAETIVQRIYRIIHRFLCCNPVTIPVLVCRPDRAFAVPYVKPTRPPPPQPLSVSYARALRKLDTS